MSPADDAYSEMADLGASWPRHSVFDPLTLDEGTASRILDGLGQADVPPGYVGLAKLLGAASAPRNAGSQPGPAAATGSTGGSNSGGESNAGSHPGGGTGKSPTHGQAHGKP